ADPDPDRARRARLARRGARRGRRRLPGQAVRAPGAARAPAGVAAPPAAAWIGAVAGRGPDAECRYPRGGPLGASDRPDPARVRAARVPDAQRANRDLAPAPAGRGLGL